MIAFAGPKRCLGNTGDYTYDPCSTNVMYLDSCAGNNVPEPETPEYPDPGERTSSYMQKRTVKFKQKQRKKRKVVNRIVKLSRRANKK